MGGELFTAAQKAAVRASQPVVAGDLLLVAEYAAKGLASVREEAQALREQVRELAELVKLLAHQSGGLDENRASEMIKTFVFAHEAQTMKTVVQLAAAMDELASLPLMTFVGPFTEKTHYRGNCTQRDARLWICTVDKTDSVPGTSSDWRQIAIGK